ncbi:hypothetical protein MIMGU_mgv1a017790mg [Erythranthe guttata]|uniref:MATH domain-containing protein n=1 Tax=Erythranthe guttata TaxID=4155 RepID=A0A022R607_ERYGU|nr:hypothetical protein MIMGU_mgv1a017790mg [Erythranthe guttata]
MNNESIDRSYFHRGGGRSSDRRRKAAAKHRRMAVVEKRRTSVVEQRWLSSGAKRWLSSGAGRTAVAEQRQTSTLTEGYVCVSNIRVIFYFILCQKRTRQNDEDCVDGFFGLSVALWCRFVFNKIKIRRKIDLVRLLQLQAAAKPRFMFNRWPRDAPPAHFLTKIESFSLLSEYRVSKYESKVFEVDGYKWRLVIYPNGGEGQIKGNNVSVYLAMADTSSLPVDWELYADFTIFLYDQFSDNYLCFRGNVRRFHATKSKWGFPKFMSKKSLRDQSSGYLVKDNIVLGAEVFVMKKQRIVESVTVLKPMYTRLRDWKIVEFSKLEVSHWFTYSSTCCGQSAFISLAKLRDPENGFLVDDCCNVQVEIFVQLIA